MKKFGEKLRTLREYHAITLLQLAHALGYSTHSYISEIEVGRKIPTATFILKVAIVFGIQTDSLMRDDLELNISSSSLDYSRLKNFDLE